jgi:hypothetical protein
VLDGCRSTQAKLGLLTELAGAYLDAHSCAPLARFTVSGVRRLERAVQVNSKPVRVRSLCATCF